MRLCKQSGDEECCVQVVTMEQSRKETQLPASEDGRGQDPARDEKKEM